MTLPKVTPGGVIAVLVLILLFGVARSVRESERRVAWEKRADSVMGAERKTYQDSTANLQLLLRTERAWRRRLEESYDSARLFARQAKARVDTLRLGFQQDTTARDSLRTALGVIEGQDTVIARQNRQIQTLGAIVAADSGIAALFQAKRVTDSTRIVRLEATLASRPGRPGRFLGIRLPTFHCIAGVGVGFSVAGKATAPGIAGCGLGY